MYLNGLCKECPTLVLWHWKSEYVLQLVCILDPCLAFSCPTVTGPQGLQNKKWARCETEWNSQDAESSETSQVWNEAKKIIGCREWQNKPGVKLCKKSWDTASEMTKPYWYNIVWKYNFFFKFLNNVIFNAWDQAQLI